MQLRSTATAVTAALLTLSASLGTAVAASADTAVPPAPVTSPVASPRPTPATTPVRPPAIRPTGSPVPVAVPLPTTSVPADPAPTASVPSVPVPVPVPVPSSTLPATPVPGVPTPPAPTAPPVTPAPTQTPTPTPVVPLPTAAALSVTSGRTTVTRTVTLTGSHFENLAGVAVGSTAVTGLTVLDPSHARFVVPAAADYQAGPKALSLRAGSDWTLRPTGVAYTYLVRTKVERQMAYAFQNWNRTSSSRFGYLSYNDCANFTSQTLLARGWKPSTQWFNAGQGDWSSTWVSSTAMSDWLKHRPDLATRLPYRQRDEVVVGDIVQFHWGWGKAYTGWDHTAVVSKVVVLPNGRHDIYYVAHTNNSQYGGSTQYFAAHYPKALRMQFWHLQ